MHQYRQATAADLPSICALGDEVNGLHHAAWPLVFAEHVPPDQQRKLWEESLHRDGAAIFVAVAGEVVVGFVSVAVVNEASPFFRPVRYGKIGSICVTQAHRGQGVGHQLMAHAECWAGTQGAAEVHLNVWAFNARARDLYEELGYEVRSHHMVKDLPKTRA